MGVYYDIINRSEYKLAEILHHTNLEIQENTKVLDLCGAPGGMCKLLAEKQAVSQVVSVSIKRDINYKRRLVVEEPYKSKVVLYYCDIYDSSIFDCVEYNKYELVIADGGLETTHDSIQLKLISREWELAKLTLSIGGNFIIKLLEITPAVYSKLREMASHFDELTLYKPLATSPVSSEIYAICRGFSIESRAIVADFDDSLKQLTRDTIINVEKVCEAMKKNNQQYTCTAYLGVNKLLYSEQLGLKRKSNGLPNLIKKQGPKRISIEDFDEEEKQHDKNEIEREPESKTIMEIDASDKTVVENTTSNTTVIYNGVRVPPKDSCGPTRSASSASSISTIVEDRRVTKTTSLPALSTKNKSEAPTLRSMSVTSTLSIPSNMERGVKKIYDTLPGTTHNLVFFTYNDTVNSNETSQWARVRPGLVFNINKSCPGDLHLELATLRQSRGKHEIIVINDRNHKNMYPVRADGDPLESLKIFFENLKKINNNVKNSFFTFVLEKEYLTDDNIKKITSLIIAWNKQEKNYVEIYLPYKSSEEEDKSFGHVRKTKQLEFERPSYWNLSSAEKFKARQYNPSYVDESDLLGYYRNALIERTELARISDSVQDEIHRDFYKRVVSGIITWPVPDEKINLIKNDKVNYGLYDFKSRTWVIRQRNKPKDQEYKMCHDGQGFKEFEPNNKNISNSLVIVSDATELMLDGPMYDVLRQIKPSDVKVKDLQLISGVAGSGKSTEIMRKATTGELILTSTKESRRDLTNRLKLLKKSIEVKTIDSFILNAQCHDYSVVWIDEALMRHAGDIVAVSLKSRCDKLILFGDTAQIPYICRVPSTTVRYHLIPPMIPKECVSYRNISHRVPMDVACIIKTLYEPMDVKTTNIVRRSVNLVICYDIGALPNLKGIKCLTFKQAEKQALLAAGYDVSTVHEYQGSAAEHIAVIRLSTLPQEHIFLTDAHALVAITRHMKSFTYYTPVTSDALSGLCNQLVSEAEINKVRINTGGFLKDYLDPQKPSTVVLKKNLDTVRDLSCDPDVVCGRVITIDLDDSDFLRNIRSVVPKGKINAINVLQCYYDGIFPEAVVADTQYDQLIVETSDLEFSTEALKMTMSKKKPVKYVFDKLRPNLKTGASFNKQDTQTETLLAMLNRNLNTPQLQGSVDTEATVSQMVENFLRTFIDEDKAEILNEYQTNQILLSSDNIEEWTITQDAKQVELIERNEAIWELPINEMSFMTKATAKPVLEYSKFQKYPVAQTISYHGKDINVAFSPLFREVKKRLIAILKKKFKIYTDMSPEAFVDKLTVENPPYSLGNSTSIEVDVSKFDKSQGELLLKFECKIYEILGLPVEMCKLWYDIHEKGVLRDLKNGLSITVAFQRRSGDAATFIGNTIVLMGMLGSVYDLQSCTLGLFSGDDSLLYGNQELLTNQSVAFAINYNMETKVFKYKYNYFCSKFLIIVNDRWYFIPDVLKLTTKLGRKDLANWEHCKEYFISVGDLSKSLSDMCIYQELSNALVERYGGVMRDLTPVFQSIQQLTSSWDDFKTLFYTEPTDNLNEDPSMKKLD